MSNFFGAAHLNRLKEFFLLRFMFLLLKEVVQQLRLLPVVFIYSQRIQSIKGNSDSSPETSLDSSVTNLKCAI